MNNHFLSRVNVMKGVLYSKVPRDEYSRARGKGRLEVFFNTLLGQDGRIPTLEKALGLYAHEFEKKPYWEGFVRPHRIIGTINLDRHYCFSKSYYPLPHFDSGDFAYKWTRVLSDTSKWLDYPINCYEFLHNYYVKEGNKRVSVSRYLNLPGIKANITRIIPLNLEREEVRCYHEFLSYERQTGVGWLWFTYEGAFAELTNLMNKHHLNHQELKESVVSPYFKVTGNYSGPYDPLIDYLSDFPGKYASRKYQEKTFKHVMLMRKQKQKTNS